MGGVPPLRCRRATARDRPAWAVLAERRQTGRAPMFAGPQRFQRDPSAAQVTRQPGLGLQAPDQLAAPAARPGVATVDELLEMANELAADGLVTLGLLGVVADHEPVGPGAVVTVAGTARGDRDLLDPQVLRHGAIAARAPASGGTNPPPAVTS